jgi:taurine dioxygenase
VVGTINQKRVAGSLGAEIVGVDLPSVDDETFAQIHSAFLEHHVLVFRGQDFTPEQLIAYGERFGTLQVHPIVPSIDGYPPVICIPNLGKKHTLTEIWHSDVTFAPTPPLGSILYALEVPEYGGDTLFANQHLAYDRLSPGLKSILEGLEAIHSGDGLASSVTGDPDETWKLQGTRHPVVRTHPDSGRKALYVNPAFTRGFADMTGEESEPLLKYLYAQGTKPDLTMRHSWRKGDVVMWDNRSVMHFAVHDHGDAPRDMHRITVDGDTPS